MGVTGLWNYLAEAPERQSLCTAFSSTSSGLKVAIDVSIWCFQCAAAVGGENPALRTFYHRLCRLRNFGIQAIFVFDGPDRPAIKRGKVRADGDQHLEYRELINLFGFHVWQAPGEAEAEAARLQILGFVDAVLSEDVDSLLFGATKVYRFWSAVDVAGRKSSQDLSHTLLYRKCRIRDLCGLSAADMILVALLAGGDYSHGLPGCGIKLAIEIAKAGYGTGLTDSTDDLIIWRRDLQQLLTDNPDGLLTRKHPSIRILDTFPALEILRYYTRPMVTETEIMTTQAATILWDASIDYLGIADFGRRFFDWQGQDGDLKLIRTLARPILIEELRRRASTRARSSDARTMQDSCPPQGITLLPCSNPKYDITIHAARRHASADLLPELRVSYTPISIVPMSSCTVDGDLVTAPLESVSTLLQSSIESLDVIKGTAVALQYCNNPVRTWISQALLESAYPHIVRDWTHKSLCGENHTTPTPRKTQVGPLDRFVSNVAQSKAATAKAAKAVVPIMMPVLDMASSMIAPPQIIVQTPAGKLAESGLGRQQVSRKICNVDTTPIDLTNEEDEQSISSEMQAQTSRSDVITANRVARPAAKSTTTKNSSIKSYFGVTKPNDFSSTAESDFRKVGSPGLASKSITAEAPLGKRQIVLRKSLPGAWRTATAEDKTCGLVVLDVTTVVDLS